VHFDWTITLGNVLASGSFAILAVIAWRDLIWRISNLEKWRQEHMIDADARDKILESVEKMITKFDVIIEEMKHERRNNRR
jgi:hypothetical protein